MFIEMQKDRTFKSSKAMAFCKGYEDWLPNNPPHPKLLTLSIKIIMKHWITLSWTEVNGGINKGVTTK